MIRALLFDLDGTLADTIPAIREAVNSTLRHYGFGEKNYDEVRLSIGSGARNLIKSILPAGCAYDEAFVGEVLKFYNSEYEKTFLLSDRCYPGMREAVEELIKRGYKVAILSNKPDRFVRVMAEMLFPDGGISFAAGQGGLPIKPDPASSLMVAGKLGVSADECAFIGDSDVDVLTAKNAGMCSVGCAWGYRGAQVLRKAGAEVIIEKPEELLEIFPDKRKPM
jgi:phosphoglycolate phosphatase